MGYIFQQLYVTYNCWLMSDIMDRRIIDTEVNSVYAQKWPLFFIWQAINVGAMSKSSL